MIPEHPELVPEVLTRYRRLVRSELFLEPPRWSPAEAGPGRVESNLSALGRHRNERREPRKDVRSLRSGPLLSICPFNVRDERPGKAKAHRLSLAATHPIGRSPTGGGALRRRCPCRRANGPQPGRADRGRPDGAPHPRTSRPRWGSPASCPRSLRCPRGWRAGAGPFDGPRESAVTSRMEGFSGFGPK